MSQLDVQEAVEISQALQRSGFSRKDRELLCKGFNLRRFRSVLRGEDYVAIGRHVINCRASPMGKFKEGLEEHVKYKRLVWNPSRFLLWTLSPDEERPKTTESLFRRLAGNPCWELPNIKVLEHLLEYPYLIPNEWRYRSVSFLGTRYRKTHSGKLYVRSLTCEADTASSSITRLDDDRIGSWQEPVAIFMR